MSGQQVRLLTTKRTVPEVKILNKLKGRVSYENTYLVLAEDTLTEDTSSLDEPGLKSIPLHYRMLSNT